MIVLAIKGEGSHMRFNPAPDEVIHEGDHLIAMGEPVGLRRLEHIGDGARMKITTAAEMREIDRATTERFGVPSLTLMENAGAAIAQFILEEYGEANRVAVICGKGNNGGDGFVVARKLHRAGRVVEVLLLAAPSDLRGDALSMFERLPLRPIEAAECAGTGG